VRSEDRVTTELGETDTDTDTHGAVSHFPRKPFQAKFYDLN
jgi:hypothetical protein